MKLNIAFNGDLELLPKLASLSSVESIFTKLTSDIVGGGRPSYVLPTINMKNLALIVKEAVKHDLYVSYLLNTACQGNREYTRTHNKKLVRFIHELYEIGIRHVVIATPYMLDFIKAVKPDIHVTISIFAYINSVEKARHWQNRGADRIILDAKINRDFELLEKIRENTECELSLYANTACLSQCPYEQFHASSSSHASSSADPFCNYSVSYETLNCTRDKLMHPVEILKARWIRPEDLKYYERIGIDHFKIADRQKNSKWIYNAAQAYNNRSYDGNLMDILPFILMKSDMKETLVVNPGKEVLRPEFVNIDSLSALRSIKYPYVYIDNKELDGFIDLFMGQKCSEAICSDECAYCEAFIDKALRINKEEAEQAAEILNNICKMFTSGEAFKRNSPIKAIIAFIIRKLNRKKNYYDSFN